MATRGINRTLHRFGLRVPRLVVHGDDTTPIDTPFHLFPCTEPSGTPVEGDIYWDNTANAPKFYNGSAWVTVADLAGASSFTDLTTTDDVVVGDDLTLNSNAAVITVGATGAVTLTHSTDTLTLGTGDTFVADDITVNDDLSVGDDLNLTSTGAVITIGPAGTNPAVITHSADTLTLASGDTFAVTTADKLTVGGIIVPQALHASFLIRPQATVTEYDLFIAPRALTVTRIDVVPSTAEGAPLTATVVKATGTSAPAKTTTPMHTADAINLNAAAYTVQNITLTVTGADLALAAGDRIGIDFSAAVGAATATVTISYKYS